MWSPSWQVRNSRSPQTAGVEPPAPGSFSFQATLSAFHCVGRRVSPLTPSLSGPRHCGQFSAGEAVAADSRTETTMPQRRTAEESVMAGSPWREDIGMRAAAVGTSPLYHGATGMSRGAAGAARTPVTAYGTAI